MGLQYVELERDFTLLLWLGISMNDNLSQKVYTADCLSILSERTVRFQFLAVTKALIGDQREYSSSAGLRLVKFHGSPIRALVTVRNRNQTVRSLRIDRQSAVYTF